MITRFRTGPGLAASTLSIIHHITRDILVGGVLSHCLLCLERHFFGACSNQLHVSFVLFLHIWVDDLASGCAHTG